MDPAMDAGTEVRLCDDQALRLLGLPAKLRGKHRRLVRPAQDGARGVAQDAEPVFRSEEHTSALQSLMRNSYAVFRLKKKNKHCDNAITTPKETTTVQQR